MSGFGIMGKMCGVFGVVRQTRQRCESGVYHVVLRRINRDDIFFDDDVNPCVRKNGSY